jgi:hypothetical protein
MGDQIGTEKGRRGLRFSGKIAQRHENDVTCHSYLSPGYRVVTL